MDVQVQGLKCPTCATIMRTDSDFCPDCGTLMLDHALCQNHPESAAEGVCVICCTPYCSECGRRVHGIFLCTNHQESEIYEGMARIHGVNDEATAKYYVECLRAAGLHAVMFGRKNGPFGFPDYTLFNATGEYSGRIINEYKIMVPCGQVLDAEKVLEDLITQNEESQHENESAGQDQP